MKFTYSFLAVLLLFTSCQEARKADSAKEQAAQIAPKHLLKDYPAMLDNGHVNVFVEIPAGTTAKWEVMKDDGQLHWEMKNGKNREVNYLPFPANYGLIPQTLMDVRTGGDGDALDVILLGSAVEKGSFHDARLVAILKLLDRGEKDDKLIAISSDSNFKHIQNFESLQNYYPGLSDIIQTWFSNYKGKGKMEFIGWGDEVEANVVLKEAMDAFKRNSKKQ